MAKEDSNQKRGWIFDQLMIVGELEAAMNHNDEEICNLHQNIADNPEDPDKIQKWADELNNNYEIIAIDYKNRVNALNQIFNAVEGSNRHYYCQLKHRAALFIMAAETYHARGGAPEAEEVLIEAGKSLALTCSVALGFEPFECLRCLDEKIADIMGKKSI